MKKTLFLIILAMTIISCSDEKSATDSHMNATNMTSSNMNQADNIGQIFLNNNAKKEGVMVTKSGLQYLVINKGNGSERPTATDRVKVHYHGTLVDGTVFDSSVDRGQPISFSLNQVIKGWTEGLQLMTVGEKTRFFIPSNLAYGKRGAGRSIGADETLIFEVELLGINQ